MNEVIRTKKGITMSDIQKNHFTAEQVEQFKRNQFVSYVSSTTIRFTDVFRTYFEDSRAKGKTVRQIFIEAGIDPDVLGVSRIEGFCYNLNKKKRKKEDFTKVPYTRIVPNPNTTEDRIKVLEHELAYTRQEVEFLKKIYLADLEAQK